MLRIFLPLYLILAVFFMGFIAAVNFLPEMAALYLLDVSEEDMSRGSFYLVEQSLPDSDFEEQLKSIEQLQTHFGYPIKLLKAHDPLLEEADWKRILTGGMISIEIDEAEYDIKTLANSDNAIAISFSESLSSSVHKTAQGTFHLIQKKLINHPQQQWPEIMAELQTHFGIPIAITRFDELDISPTEKQRLLNGRIIDLDHDESAFDYYTAKLNGSPYVLQAGPIKQPFTEITLLTTIGLSFILCLAIALSLWLRPLWKSMNELSRTANDFGEGKLDARADVKPRAALGKLAGQFNAMAEKVDRLISGQRDLTNAVSHELRTPIARMRFGLEMLSQNDQQASQRHLTGLNTDVDDLESLVNELLHYARFEQIDSLPDIENINVAEWLENIIENARGYAGDVSITLDNKLESPLNTQCSPHYLARVVHNLLRNASRYSQQQINVLLDIAGDEITICVDDDGIGIAQQDRQRAFEPFSRLDKSRNRQSGGHGLGLAIAKRIIEAHKGTISISDSPQGGARFTLILNKS